MAPVEDVTAAIALILDGLGFGLGALIIRHHAGVLPVFHQTQFIHQPGKARIGAHRLAAGVNNSMVRASARGDSRPV